VPQEVVAFFLVFRRKKLSLRDVAVRAERFCIVSPCDRRANGTQRIRQYARGRTAIHSQRPSHGASSEFDKEWIEHEASVAGGHHKVCILLLKNMSHRALQTSAGDRGRT
jgi:hypothetical protein